MFDFFFDQNVFQNLSIYLKEGIEYSVKLFIFIVLVNRSHCLLSLESPVFH